MTTSSGTESLLHGRGRHAAVRREGSMVGQGVRREQLGLVCRRKNRTAPMGGLDSQQAAGPMEIDNVNGCTEPGRQPAARIE
jgi:hypothetical protein